MSRNTVVSSYCVLIIIPQLKPLKFQSKENCFQTHVWWLRGAIAKFKNKNENKTKNENGNKNENENKNKNENENKSKNENENKSKNQNQNENENKNEN